MPNVSTISEAPIVVYTLNKGKGVLDSAGLLWNKADRFTLDFIRRALPLKGGYTRVSIPRLYALYSITLRCIESGIPGAYVECGVWKGGSSALVNALLQTHDPTGPRPMWLFDSFAGLPQPSDKDGEGVQERYYSGILAADQGYVLRAHKRAGSSLENVRVIPGWFNETLPQSREAIGAIAILHVDVDLYESVYCVLSELYDQVSPGGAIVIDDYGSEKRWPGCRRAVHTFFQERGLDPEIIQKSDRSGAFFFKPMSA